MSLQQGLNQLLGQAAISARLSPNFERNVELGKLKRQETALSKQYESIGEAGLYEYDEAAESIEQGVLSSEAEIAERRFELQPSEKTLSQYKEKLNQARDFANKQEFMRQMAMDSMQSKGQAQVQQRDTFQKLQESLSQDEDFSRLGKSAQEYIIAQLAKEDKNGK